MCVSIGNAAEGDTCHAGFQLIVDATEWRSARSENRSRKDILAQIKTLQKDIARFRKKGTLDETGKVEDLAKTVADLKKVLKDPIVETVTLTNAQEIKTALDALGAFPTRINGTGYSLPAHPNLAVRIGLGIPVLYTMALVPVALLSAKFGLRDLPVYYALGSLPASWIALPFLWKGVYLTPKHDLAKLKSEDLTFRRLGLLESITKGLTREDGAYHDPYFAAWSDKSGTFGLWYDESGGSPRLHLFVTPAALASP